RAPGGRDVAEGQGGARRVLRLARRGARPHDPGGRQAHGRRRDLGRRARPGRAAGPDPGARAGVTEAAEEAPGTETMSDAARRYNVTIVTVRKWRDQGAPFRQVGRNWLC